MFERLKEVFYNKWKSQQKVESMNVNLQYPLAKKY